MRDRPKSWTGYYSPCRDAAIREREELAIRSNRWNGRGISERAATVPSWVRRAANRVPDGRVSKTPATMRVARARSTEKARADAFDRWSRGSLERR